MALHGSHITAVADDFRLIGSCGSDKLDVFVPERDQMFCSLKSAVKVVADYRIYRKMLRIAVDQHKGNIVLLQFQKHIPVLLRGNRENNQSGQLIVDGLVDELIFQLNPAVGGFDQHGIPPLGKVALGTPHMLHQCVVHLLAEGKNEGNRARRGGNRRFGDRNAADKGSLFFDPADDALASQVRQSLPRGGKAESKACGKLLLSGKLIAGLQFAGFYHGKNMTFHPFIFWYFSFGFTLIHIKNSFYQF